MCRNNSQTLHTCTLTRGGSRLFVGGGGGGGGSLHYHSAQAS